MNIAAIPFSYDGSTLTQVTVNFSYSRYTVSKQNPRSSNDQRDSINLSSDNIRIASASASNASTAVVPVGYIDGQPYYGPFHEHTRADGTVVRMVGAEHVGTPHAVIYGTVAESIAQTVSTPTPSPASSPTPSPSPAPSPSPSPAPVHPQHLRLVPHQHHLQHQHLHQVHPHHLVTETHLYTILNKTSCLYLKYLPRLMSWYYHLQERKLSIVLF